MIVRKRRTREHIIADLSVNFVERQALLCGHTVERVFHDYGYDLSLMTYDENGEPEPGDVLIQVKATDAIPLLKDSQTISWRLHRTDLARWLFEPAPVILIVYDAQTEAAYWLYVQQYFQQIEHFNLFSAGQTITAHLQRSQVVDGIAIRQFQDFKAAIVSQMRGDQGL